jgi:aldose 1-epimerase
VTGQEFEIRSGAAVAVITQEGAGLRSFEVGGVPFVESFAAGEHPPFGAGNVLIPWPNRVKDGRWSWQGQDLQLEQTEKGRANAIHGLVRHGQWQVIARQEQMVTLGYDIPVQAGWPVSLETSISYMVSEEGLTIIHGVRNVGTQAIPFGVGTHPYPRAGKAETDDCTLQLAATTVLPLNPDDQIPSAPAHSVEGTEYDFRTPRSLSGVDLDTPFGGVKPESDGLVHHWLRSADVSLEVWAEPAFKWVQVFTPPAYPGRGRAIAIEPMTCPPDALNSKEDLIVLEPDATWSASWGFRIH